MAKKLLTITGMHCVSCSMSIDGELEDTNGVKSAKTSYAKGQCEVEFDETIVTTDEIIQLVKKTGYQAEEQ